MKKPKTYNLTPAEGQALLNFQGRLYPKTINLFETEIIEEIKQKKNKRLKLTGKEKELHPDFQNLLIQGDCLSVCAYLKSENINVDLVYIDPPFASGANYAKKIYLRNSGKMNIENDDNSIGEEIMYSDIWQKEDYLNWFYERLLAIKEIMSEEASIYLHLDWHIEAYAKVLMDEIFGEENFRSQIVWNTASLNVAGFKTQANNWIYSQGIILYYVKNNLKDSFIFNKQYLKTLKYPYEDKKGKYRLTRNDEKVYENKDKGDPVTDIWNDILSFNYIAAARESLNYTTQKPEALLERIIKASSDKGMIVADFFCGSGTALRKAYKLERKFIGCDIGSNAIQTTRDELAKIGADFDILKVKDGLRLFRNPAQTTARLFGLIDGFKTSAELELGSFWDGGIVNDKGSYEPIKFIGVDKTLTKKLLDVILEEIYRLEDTKTGVSKVKLVYAYKDLDIDQSYVNKTIKKAGKTNIKIELVGLDELLDEKKEMLYTLDNADIEVKKQDKQYKVKIKKYFSPYLKKKIDEYNAKKVKNGQRELEDKNKMEEIKISNTGLELIEAIQFDTTLKKSGVWVSNLELEDKAGSKEKIKGEYLLNTNKFKIKIRNIAGDEITISSKDLKNEQIQ